MAATVDLSPSSSSNKRRRISSGEEDACIEVSYKLRIPSESVPSDLLETKNECKLKDWIWEKYQTEIKSSLSIRDTPPATTAQKSLSTKEEEKKETVSDSEQDVVMKAASEASKRQTIICHANPQEQRLKLLDNISSVQRQYLQRQEPRVVFGNLLENLLQLTGSEYGFIGEVKIDKQNGNTKYLQTHAITNIAWNAATQAFYEQNVESGLKFTNLNSLFGHVIVSESPVVSNTPSNHPAACGIPDGHPPLNHFLGIPFFEGNQDDDNNNNNNSDKQQQEKRIMNGMVGIANKPGGYSQADIDFLEPFTITCSNLIQAYGAIRQNKYLINTLEEKVTTRTQALALANQHLEQANKRVMAASRAQLQHFACMSHEIRTPLNCIMGLSSLLQDTPLNPHQADSLQMIVTSGDLLLTVVNDVLDYSKLESGNVDICLRPSNLQGALDAVVHSIQQKAKTKHLQIETSYELEVPHVFETDSRRLQQILYNLLGNAVKFSPEHGTIELKVSVENGETKKVQKQEQKSSANTQTTDEAKVEDQEKATSPTKQDDTMLKCPFQSVANRQDGSDNTDKPRQQDEGMSKCPFLPVVRENAQDGSLSSSSSSSKLVEAAEIAENGQETKLDGDAGDQGSDVMMEDASIAKSRKVLRFQVKDYGTGIDQKDFQRIFKPFKQANSITEQLHGGTGLGLAITSKLVRGLGGRIRVDSVKGKWSEFTVDFPFPIQDENGESDKAEEEDKGLFEGITILSVSNKNDARKVEQNVFSKKRIHFRKLASMKEMMTILPGLKLDNTNNDGSGQFYICLVQEDLFDVETYQTFVSALQRQQQCCTTSLITFGPQYSVHETDHHFRSLSQVLPSVLIKKFLQQQEAKQKQIQKIVPEDNNNNNNKSPSSKTSTNIIHQLPRCPRQNSKVLLKRSLSSASRHEGGRSSDDAKKNNSASFTAPISYDAIRVMIAEDNPINQKVLQRMLNRLGVKHVDIVENGKLAVDRYKETINSDTTGDSEQDPFYHIIYMDMQMPVMDGLEATRHITKLKKEQHVSSSSTSSDDDDADEDDVYPKIIFVTANVTEDYENEAREAGGDGFISKPFNIDGIDKSLRKLERL